MTTTADVAPPSVDRALILIAIAVAAGAVEAILRTAIALERPDADVGALALGLAVRAAIYAAVVGIAVLMHRGRRWARTTLTVGLGTVGLASLTIEPMAAVLSSNPGLFDGITLDSVLLALVRVLHIFAVVAALISMYRPDARRYFVLGLRP